MGGEGHTDPVLDLENTLSSVVRVAYKRRAALPSFPVESPCPNRKSGFSEDLNTIHTLTKWKLSGWTVRMDSVLPCRYALVIAGS
jgi:hypothetical protein